MYICLCCKLYLVSFHILYMFEYMAVSVVSKGEGVKGVT